MTLDLNKPSDARAYIDWWAMREGYALEDVNPDLGDAECLMLAHQIFLCVENEKNPAQGSSH